MELLLIVLAVIAVGGYFIWKENKHQETGTHPLDGATKTPEPWPFPTSRPPEGENKDNLPVMPTLTAVLDVNKDGKVDTKDVVSVLDVNKDGNVDTKDVVSVVDVNKDGKVDLKDAVAAADVLVETTKKTAKKVKAKAVEITEKAKKTGKKTKTKNS